jgi:curved DNA-binding protein CbpA
VTTERDAYSVLQVQPDADHAVVQAAYRALARRYHPDGESPHAERMTEINRAWERVRTVERRQVYDLERRRQPVPVGPGKREEVYDPYRHRTSEAVAKPAADVLDFGRYEGWRIVDIARHDPDYLRWLSRHSTGVRYLESIARCLPGEPLGRRVNALG